MYVICKDTLVEAVDGEEKTQVVNVQSWTTDVVDWLKQISIFFLAFHKKICVVEVYMKQYTILAKNNSIAPPAGWTYHITFSKILLRSK